MIGERRKVFRRILAMADRAGSLCGGRQTLVTFAKLKGGAGLNQHRPQMARFHRSPYATASACEAEKFSEQRIVADTQTTLSVHRSFSC